MILATHRGDVEMREQSVGSLLEAYGLSRGGFGPTAGVLVTSSSAASIPAVHAGVSFAAEAVASLDRGVWRGQPRRRVTTTWQARLFRGQPNRDQNWFMFFETVSASLDFRGNAYIWKSKAADGRVVALWALHPEQVGVTRESTTGRILFSVAFGGAYPTPSEMAGKTATHVDSSTVLHIRGRGGTGELLAPSPITLFRTTFGVALAKQRHEANVYKNGAMGGLAVTFPGGVSVKQAEEWRESFEAKQSGVDNAGRTKVVGNGATITSIGMTQEDAQFVEASNLTLRDLAFILCLPTWILLPDKLAKPLSPEHEMQRWMYSGLGPRAQRIAAAINADMDLFGAPEPYFAFDTANVVISDRATEDTIAHERVQDGRLLQDEWRLANGLPPLPGGVGMIPQNTPVGGAPTKVPTPAAGGDEDEE